MLFYFMLYFFVTQQDVYVLCGQGNVIEDAVFLGESPICTYNFELYVQDCDIASSQMRISAYIHQFTTNASSNLY
jgi:hypothetical protein